MTSIAAKSDLPDTLFPLSVQQYHEMIRAGILADNDAVELLEGWLAQKMSKNPPHSVTTNLVAESLRNLLPAGWFVLSQEPITTPDSEPEPDVALVRGNVRDYINRHPSPGEVALVIEIADATLDQDRRTKGRLYARAGIAVYWIVNLTQRKIEIHTLPSGSASEPSYGQCQDFSAGQNIPVMIEGTLIGQIAVNDILP